MDTALDLCPKLTHGDVLPHNFAFDGTHLHLLDIDEGVDEFTQLTHGNWLTVVALMMKTGSLP